MRARTLLLTLACGALPPLLGWSALTPIRTASRDQVFEIPRGTWASRMAGHRVEILPNHIHLTLGVRDILVLRNHDTVPQIFGPTLMMPGQTFRLPFEQPAVYTFACTAHPSGQMIISVDPYPGTPWARIEWRARETLWHARLLATHLAYHYHL